MHVPKDERTVSDVAVEVETWLMASNYICLFLHMMNYEFATTVARLRKLYDDVAVQVPFNLRYAGSYMLQNQAAKSISH